MKFSWKGLAIAIVIALLIFAHAMMGLYVCANIIDWKIDFLNINPSEPSNERNFPVMTYPPSTGSGFQIVDSWTTIIFEHMYLRYKGTPAVNRPFEMSVVGTLDPKFAENISSVSVYFDGAVPYPVGSEMYTGSWGVSLYPTMEHQNVAIHMGAYLVGNPTVINWQVEGDYYLSITIHFENFTEVTQSYEGYKDFCIHINSADVLEQQNSRRITTSIAITSIFFAFVDGSILVGRFLLKGKKEDRVTSARITSRTPRKLKRKKKNQKKKRKKNYNTKKDTEKPRK